MSIPNTVKSISKILSLFEPYKRVVLSTDDEPGPTAMSGYRHMRFGTNNMFRRKSPIEGILHEIAHGIEIPQDRFGYESWGLHATKRNGKMIWAFERELVVLAIQCRLYKTFEEPLSWNEICESINSVDDGNFSWREANNIHLHLHSNKSLYTHCRRAIDVIDTYLPSTQRLLQRWHQKCRYLDEYPRNIKTTAEVQRLIIEPKSPLSPILKKHLREAGILTI
jgi:hypothetical protein